MTQSALLSPLRQQETVSTPASIGYDDKTPKLLNP